MIRKAEAKDLIKILDIYAAARSFMKLNGNETQWGGVYPPRELLENDIDLGQLYVCCSGDAVYGVFVFMPGGDPSYDRLEKSFWQGKGPYGAIHRVASDATSGGVFNECLNYCKKQAGNLRIDTHENNLVMQHLLKKYGFEKRGIIRLEDGSPRIAYEYAKL